MDAMEGYDANDTRDTKIQDKITMRSYDPSCEYDVKHAAAIQALPWQLELLSLNPDYTYWGPHEDCMCVKDKSWTGSVVFASWEDFGWSLDDMNECVNFYFGLSRDSKPCETCAKDLTSPGYHPDAYAIISSFYQGERWCSNITQDELDALVAHGRISPDVPLADVNAANTPGLAWSYNYHHDSINRAILIEARLKRLGIELKCPTCEGVGYLYTTPGANVELVLWMLHPRKGASRGVEILRVDRSDLPDVFAWLRRAAERNAERFGRLPNE